MELGLVGLPTHSSDPFGFGLEDWTAQGLDLTISYLAPSIIILALVCPSSNVAAYASFGEEEQKHNYLTGSIPASIGNLSSLSTRLYLNSNKLSGHIPSNIGNLRKLQVLFLFQNQLTGTILPELNNLTFFVVFALSQNELTGQLPRDTCFGGLLRPLAANDNHIQGLIPKSLIKNCTNLCRVRLERNELTGNLSEAFGTYPSLNYIDLSYNKFYGQLSEKWGESRGLTSFRISNNNISGGIPPKLAKATHLCVLDISSNQLVGEIPIKLASLISLFHLSLSDNKLSGNIPLCGSTKTCSIEKLGNFHNELHSSIQSTLDGMLSLALVDISYNQLEGPLPNIKAFQVLFEALRGNTERESLKKILSNEKEAVDFEWIKRVNVIKGVANGLFYKHHECLPPIIHQDISSKNVLLDGEYMAYISDFGIAFLKPDSYYWTSFAGTIGYAAPGTKVLRRFNNDNSFAIWSYDGKMVYENIIPVTDDFSVEHCIGVGGYGIIYKVEIASGQVAAIKKTSFFVR
ncbi:probable leucine-rich repeat receptor-like protein kinase At1g35710 [Camellia sinensis]|uniref:probable leucine-rich repeat receptor-like protein kinase At1g35710 n=1 Tax=Camellia sinensis TaxID=4442 RepID=UPI001036E743|nr:probable leucine-rich repeat receptor-like protein kinase At1g35710 [Camellia sinensis]